MNKDESTFSGFIIQETLRVPGFSFGSLAIAQAVSGPVWYRGNPSRGHGRRSPPEADNCRQFLKRDFDCKNDQKLKISHNSPRFFTMQSVSRWGLSDILRGLSPQVRAWWRHGLVKQSLRMLELLVLVDDFLRFLFSKMLIIFHKSSSHNQLPGFSRYRVQKAMLSKHSKLSPVQWCMGCYYKMCQ